MPGQIIGPGARVVTAGLPAGVTLSGPDAPSQFYWSNWPSSTFQPVNTFYPIGVFPFETNPASTKAMGINFGTPGRDDNAGLFRPIYSAGTLNTIAGVASAGSPFGMGASFFYRCQPSIPNAITTINGGVTLPTGTIAVNSTAQWQLAGAALNTVAGDTGLGQFTVQSTNGLQTVTFSGISGNSFTGCTGGTGTVANGANVNGPSWAGLTAFNVIGDELDGNPTGFLDVPTTIANQTGSSGGWTTNPSSGGIAASGLVTISSRGKAIDSTIPFYAQYTGQIVDQTWGSGHYTLSDKQIATACYDIVSFDRYPLVKGVGNGTVSAQGDYVNEMRFYTVGNSNPRCIFPFIEMDHQDGGTIYPLPAQTVAEVWQSVVQGASGIQYFDQNSNIANTSYTGNGNYAAGAMYNAIVNVNTLLSNLAEVLNSPFANGFVSGSPQRTTAPTAQPTGTGPLISARYVPSGTYTHALPNRFYVFVAPYLATSLTTTLTFAGITGTTTLTQVDLQTQATTYPSTNSSGQLSLTFSDLNQGCYIIIPNPGH